ncbi:MAG TPA: hypothetical protein VFB76_05820 [Candidatus Angelobacter sp.]|nr:hypothetical protein [Candidatus Angelobacter sp.]
MSLNVALQSAPPEIAKHISDFGSVAVRYNWSWPGALDGSVQSTDAPRSLIFVSSLGPGMNDSPWRKHSSHMKINQILEALWWKHDPGIGGFVALSNTSQDELQAVLRITAAKASDGSFSQTVNICGRCTQMVDLGELLLNLPQGATAGGMRVSYKGMPNSLVVTGGLENANEGFSAGMRFKAVRDPGATSPAKVSAQVLAGVGMMVGEQDPMMMFPTGTRFTPYAAFHNVTPRVLSVTPSIHYMDSSVARTLALPVVELAPFESRQIDPASALASLGMQKFNGYINISLAYTGGTNDLLAALGSVDQKGTYVFEVEPRRVAPSGARSVNYWNLNNGNDTMFTLWNPGEQDEKLLVTLYFMGGHYKIPVQLAAKASTMFNISDIIMERQPDPDGNRIPTFIRQGSAVISGPEDEPDTINVVVEAGTFNAKTKTCAGQCQTCYGYTDYWADPDPLYLPAGGSSQMSAIAQWMNGTQYNKTFLSSWSSDGPAATVSSGMVTGVSAGTADITASLVANIPGTACSGFDDLEGDPTECPIEDTMEADPPVTVAQKPHIDSLDPDIAMINSSTVQITLNGSGFSGSGNTAPTVTLPAGFTKSGQSNTDARIVVIVDIGLSANIGLNNFTVTTDIGSSNNGSYGCSCYASYTVWLCPRKRGQFRA